MFYFRLCPKLRLYFVLLAAGFLGAVFAAAPAMAQPRAATVNSFNGEIVVASASQPLPPQAQLGSQSPAGAPAILTYSGEVRVVLSPQPTLPRSQPGKTAPDGCRIVTESGASATLTLPDGSQIGIHEMTILELNGFAWDKQTNLRGMLMSLYAGSVRVAMAPAYHERGSFFEIKTPNALLSLHFSQPDVEVIYAPSKMENMAALLEEGVTIAQEEAGLWQDVLTARADEGLRRQNEQRARTQIAALPRADGVPLPTGGAQLGAQKTFAEIGLIQTEEDTLLQARRQQRNENLANRFAQAVQPQAPAVQVADAATAGRVLPNSDLAQWQTDGLIVGEDKTGMGTTFVFAYTASVNFMNRLTRESRTLQHGQWAVVRGPGITMTMLNGNPMQAVPPRNVGATFALDSPGMSSLDKPAESSIQNREDDSSSSQSPGSIGRPERWSNRPRPHNIEITIEE